MIKDDGAVRSRVLKGFVYPDRERERERRRNRSQCIFLMGEPGVSARDEEQPSDSEAAVDTDRNCAEDAVGAPVRAG